MKTRSSRKLAAQNSPLIFSAKLLEFRNWLKENDYRPYSANRWQKDEKLSSGLIRTQRIDLIGHWVLLYREWVNWELSPPMGWEELKRGRLVNLVFKPTRIHWK